MPGSGIFSTLNFGAETSWGTYAVGTRAITFAKESLTATKVTQQSKVMHGGIYDLSARRVLVKTGAKGTVDFGGLYARSMGLVFKNMLGAVAVTGSSGAGYTQVYTPADTTGLSLSGQVGRPMTNNTTIQAFTYEGLKVTSWQMGIKAGEFATFTADFDGKEEDTSQTYATPSYTSGSTMLTGVEAAFIIGGTVTTTAGVTSVSGGTTVTLAKDVSVTGTNGLDTERYYLGSIYKQEQLINDTRQIKGSATVAFNDLSTIYTAFASDAPVALQMTFTGNAYISGTSTYPSAQLLIPNVFWDEDKINVDGPKLIDQAITFTGLDDGTDNPIQLTYVTADSAP